MRATTRPGHQAAAVAPRTATKTIAASRVQGRLSGSMRWPTAGSSVGTSASQIARPSDRPDQCADRADDRAVRQQHEPEVLLGRADRRERAELAEPSLRDDGEARGGNQRGQEQEDGGHGEHRQRVCRPVALPSLGPREGGPVAAGGPIREGVDRVGVGVDQDRDLVRCSRGRGGDEGELVAQITWVLDDADDGPATAVEGQSAPRSRVRGAWPRRR